MVKTVLKKKTCAKLGAIAGGVGMTIGMFAMGASPAAAEDTDMHLNILQGNFTAWMQAIDGTGPLDRGSFQFTAQASLIAQLSNVDEGTLHTADLRSDTLPVSGNGSAPFGWTVSVESTGLEHTAPDPNPDKNLPPQVILIDTPDAPVIGPGTQIVRGPDFAGYDQVPLTSVGNEILATDDALWDDAAPGPSTFGKGVNQIPLNVQLTLPAGMVQGDEYDGVITVTGISHSLGYNIP